MMEKKRCKQRVYPPGTFGGFHPYQCTRFVWSEHTEDGYCKIHHPITVKARQDKSHERYMAKMEKDPWVLLARAQQTIRELQDELEALRPIPQKR